ncbi:MAG: fimbrial protein [Enterobacteriaceae bacterium]|nr:fimbrial protein [Enterobacteriaceae bacterium]
MMLTIKKTKLATACLAVMALLSSPAYAITYIVGNEMPQPENKDIRVDPPYMDGTPTWNKIMGRTAAVHTQGPTPNMIAKYDWSGAHDSGMADSGTSGQLYCRKDGNDTSLNVEHGYGSPYGAVDGHPIWKTNIDGLYFAVEVARVFLPMTLNTTPSSPFWLNGPFVIDGTPNDPSCDDERAAGQNKVVIMGGVQLGFNVYLYADNTFTPQTTISNLEFPKSGYDLRVFNSTAGGLGSGHSIKFILNLSGFNMAWPTCAANSVTSNGKTGYTVDLGSYYPKQISNNQTQTVPFTINLKSCTYVTNIEVKLDSTNIGANDKTLLTNSATEDPAKGVGVQIKGLKNDSSVEMVLIPGDSSSIYKDTNPLPSRPSNRNDNSDPGNATKDLNFNATLKQDGNATIMPGKFKATGRFTINYP